MTTARSLLHLVVWSAVCASGCGQNASADPTVSVTDSAGVKVYALDRVPAWDDARYLWSVELERAIETAASEPGEEPLLFNPQSLTRLEDGTLVVLDGGDPRLAVIPPGADTVVARFGRSGQGPGEVLSSNGILAPAGPASFTLLDPGNQRWTEFSLSGDVLDEHPVRIAGSGGLAVQRPTTREVFVWRVFFGDRTARGLPLSDSVVRVDYEAGESVVVAPMPPRPESASFNTSRTPYFTPGGSFAPIGSGGVVVGRSDAFTFRHYSDEGELLALIHAPGSARSIPLREKAGIIAEIAEEFPPARRATHEDVADRFELWSQAWAFRDSLFAVEHARWYLPAGEPPVPPEQRVWRLFTVTGTYAGVIAFPPHFGFPYWVERDRILGLRRDELGVATIETYRVAPPRGRPASPPSAP